MPEYVPLKGFCRAYEWAVTQVMSNPLAAGCGVDALVAAMPDEVRVDWDDDQMVIFEFIYDHPAMREVITGRSSGGFVTNAGWWPTYEQVKALGNLPVVAGPWDD